MLPVHHGAVERLAGAQGWCWTFREELFKRAADVRLC
jgi:hypothetical protein